MYCSNCGQQIPDGSKFCPKCGQKIAVSSSPSGTEQDYSGDNQNWEENARPRMHRPEGNPSHTAHTQAVSGKNGKWLPAVIAAAVVVLIVIIIAVNHKTTVNLSKYITINVTGYDTVGTASYEFDSDQFAKDYDGKLKPDKKAIQREIKKGGEDVEEVLELFGGSDNVVDYFSNIDLSFLVSDIVSGTVTPSEDISNGDKVTFTWDISQDDLDELGDFFDCRFKADDVTITAEGLEEIETFDPFEGVSITYTGTAPDGSIENISQGSDPACADLHYSADKSTGLSNGDVITVTVSIYYEDDMNGYLIGRYGKVPGKTSKEYTVSGLPSYAASAADIPEDSLDQMKKQAEDTFSAEVASRWDADTTELVKSQYIGNYFLSAKGSGYYSDRNFIYLIYKIRAHVWASDDDGNHFDQNVDYYWYCRFRNILLTSDGECSVDLSDYSTAASSYGANFNIDSNISSGWWSYYSWNFYGYEDLDYMYNQLVTVNIDEYNSENNVTDVSFGDVSGTSGSVQGDTSSFDTADAESDSADSGQILPYSSERKLTEADVEGLDNADLQTAINEIYARHGYRFSDQNILAYFEQYDWYQPTIDSSDFSLDILSQLEKDNIQFMQDHMN